MRLSMRPPINVQNKVSIKKASKHDVAGYEHTTVRKISTAKLIKNLKIMVLSVVGVMFWAAPTLVNANIDTKYQDSCATCHDSGAFKAPRTGDTATWTKLKSEKGIPNLLNTVKNGGRQMPAGGLCPDCTDEEYEALIEYMSK